MFVNFIRHGKTLGNIQKKYIGKTDEELCEEGIKCLKNMKYPPCDVIFSSPLKRCLQTAEIIYPHKKIIVSENFRECDFGDFEGKNYAELSKNPYYQKWIDSMGKMTFPNGENPLYFKERCVSEFLNSVKKAEKNSTFSFVVHGGTIMAIMEKFCVPEKNYYDWQVKNGHGFVAEYCDKKLTLKEVL
ncbi:MAG: histidine phosphatase family protein [Ruminococcus sp.]|nr:histidine phosphatase family protein [Ruminococcus sp.]